MGVRCSSPRTANSRTAVLFRPTASPRWVGFVCIWTISHPDISVRYIALAVLSIGDRSPAGNRPFRKTNVTHVTYVYGDELGQYAGRVKRTPELIEMASEYGEFRVYVVEVCQSCRWNHLATSYVLGTGEPSAGRSRRVRPN
ncbi:MAG: DUF5318 family protein [Trebonia sp.]